MAVGSIVPVSKRSTLYPAVEPESAPAKYRHGATITPPGTLIAYRLAVDDGSISPAATTLRTGPRIEPRQAAIGDTSPESNGVTRPPGRSAMH